jgi:hypothetical protein
MDGAGEIVQAFLQQQFRVGEHVQAAEGGGAGAQVVARRLAGDVDRIGGAISLRRA